MPRIVICDDEAKQLELIGSMLREYCDQHPELGLQIQSFSSAAALLEQLRVTGGFDIYLLDVLLPGSNGIELGKKIRAVDQTGYIIYLTSSPDYAIDSYLVRASQYLLKPVSQQRLSQVLDDILAEWRRERQRYVMVKTRSGMQRLALHSLVYVELVGHTVSYHLLDGSTVESTSVRTSFREAISALLAYPQFVLCGASFAVNLACVDMVEGSTVRLVGGETLPLSRSLRTEVISHWLDHHLKGGPGV